MSPGLIRALLITDPLIIIATIILGSINLAVSIFDHGGRKQVAIARFWSKVLLKIAGVRMSLDGIEKIDPNGSYVFVSNHVSFMDTPVVLAHIPVQFRFLAKKGLFSIPFLGYHLKRAGHLPVPRENPREAVKTMAEAGRIIRERGISVLIFPEGGRSLEGLLPFKEGAAYIAIKAGVPVVPVALDGTLAVLPMGSMNVRPGHVTLRVGDPIPTANLTLQERAALTKQLHDRVADLLDGARRQPAQPAAV
ncbi:MAG TPA: lysophospholipid acyltransferase family protein [Bryobacteraceae bacterium]|nr:lysophospholipid acyltransferase family protein [Bryobacteraceae bacterium]